MSFAIQAERVPVEGFATAAKALLEGAAAQAESDEIEQVRRRLFEAGALAGVVAHGLYERARLLEDVARGAARGARDARLTSDRAKKNMAEHPEAEGVATAAARLEAQADQAELDAKAAAGKANAARAEAMAAVPEARTAHVGPLFRAQLAAGVEALELLVRRGAAGKTRYVRIEIGGHVGDEDAEIFTLGVWPVP